MADITKVAEQILNMWSLNLWNMNNERYSNYSICIWLFGIMQTVDKVDSLLKPFQLEVCQL